VHLFTDGFGGGLKVRVEIVTTRDQRIKGAFQIERFFNQLQFESGGGAVCVLPPAHQTFYEIWHPKYVTMEIPI
jgi:hypothetical protein